MANKDKKKKQHHPVDMEKRLATAYKSGYYDGASEYSELTHEVWVNISKRTKGIGPKRQAALIASARVLMAEKQNEKFGKPSQDVQEVREELFNGNISGIIT